MRAWTLAALILGMSLSGCAAKIPRWSDAAATLSRFRPKMPETRPDAVELHYIFLDADPGDSKIEEEVWQKEADEQCIALDVKAALAQNGIRIGKLGTRLSPTLLDLLSKDQSNQSGRRHHATSGHLAKVQMTEVLPSWNLFHVSNGQPSGDEIREAQGFLYVTPTITGDASVNLEIVPEIEFGPRQQKRVPSPDLAGWQLRSEKESRKFPELRANLELASGEYALIGTWPDRGATIGNKMLMREIDGKPRQLFLLIRVVRPNREELLTAGYDFDDFFLSPIRRTAQKVTTPVLETVMASRSTRR